MRHFLVRNWCALSIGAILLVTAPLGVTSRPISTGSEAREAAIAKEMAETGSFLSTRLAGGSLHEKPPFFYAAVASSIRLSGRVSLFSVRFPSVIFSAFTLLCLAGIARILFNSRAALFSCVVLATSYLFAVNAHDCLIDVSLTSLVAAALLGFLVASRRAGFPRWGALFGIAAAGGLLAKGLIGLALPAAITLPFWWLSRERRPLRESIGLAAVAIPFGALAAWAGGVFVGGGAGAVREALWDQQVGRFLGLGAREYSHHRKPFFFYIAALPGMLFPWVVSLPAAARYAFRRDEREPERVAVRSLLVSAMLGLALLSVAGTKRTVYFLPIVPVVAAALGGFLDRRLRNEEDAPGAALWIQFVPLAVSAAAIPLVPALADGRLSAAETAAMASVFLLCILTAVFVRKKATRMVGASLATAMASLLILDLFSLRRMDPDAGARKFFARVQNRVSSTDSIYAFHLNEDVLGRACLALPRRPIAQSDEVRLVRALAEPGAFLLAETRSILRAQREGKIRFEPVERGSAGDRSLVLYRTRLEQSGAKASP